MEERYSARRYLCAMLETSDACRKHLHCLQPSQ